eukprot:g5102.t1
MFALQHVASSSTRVGLHRRNRTLNSKRTLLRSSGGGHRDLLGDIGARDPFPAELESNFGDKVLGYSNTDHLIKPPDDMDKILGLKSKRCTPCEGGTPRLTEKEIERLRNQVPGWQLIKDDEGMYRIKTEWKVRNFKSGLILFKRISEIAESEKHHPDLHLISYNQVSAELYTHSIGGLSENDFILAAKINELDVSDLLPKRKQQYWA